MSFAARKKQYSASYLYANVSGSISQRGNSAQRYEQQHNTPNHAASRSISDLKRVSRIFKRCADNHQNPAHLPVDQPALWCHDCYSHRPSTKFSTLQTAGHYFKLPRRQQ